MRNVAVFAVILSLLTFGCRSTRTIPEGYEPCKSCKLAFRADLTHCPKCQPTRPTPYKEKKKVVYGGFEDRDLYETGRKAWPYSDWENRKPSRPAAKPAVGGLTGSLSDKTI